MDPKKQTTDRILWFLQERQKELNCLYRIEEALNRPNTSIAQACESIVEAIPPGWQYPDICRVRIRLEREVITSHDFKESLWSLKAPVSVLGQKVGTLEIYYIEEMPKADFGPFLKEEKRLINTIAERLASFLTYQRMQTVYSDYQTAAQELSTDARPEWRVVLDLLHRTDLNLYHNIANKMLNFLSWSGIEEAKRLAQIITAQTPEDDEELMVDSNIPHAKRNLAEATDRSCRQIFQIAEEHLSAGEISAFIQRWVQQDKLSFLIKTLSHMGSTFSNLSDAIRRFHRMAPSENLELPRSTRRGLIASLIRRILSEQLEYINVAKNFVELNDLYELLQQVVYLPDSRGLLGGKAAGLFLAGQVLKRGAEADDLLEKIKTPRAYYLTSDLILQFMSFNNFEEVIEQKYKEINQIRLEYPNVVYTFKNANFPPELVKTFSVVLDDFGDVPLIVRSSSLLEDRMGTAFSGKYKSLFLANQGPKEKRLEQLMDAIAEVYASTFGPDPLEYRAERGLLDFHEEMAVIIQEVIGKRVGKYFLPAFAGVAFSRSELRWSPRIKREDGLVRLVPGLGTRAVDRTANDYPILFSPGQPGLRVNVSRDEMIRYSPKFIDVINLEANTFETLEVEKFFRDHGDVMPLVSSIISLDKEDRLVAARGLEIDLHKERPVVTFDGLLNNTKFVKQMHSILRTLEEKLHTAVDIEFAHNGEDFYLLQCRPQSAVDESAAAPIPRDVPKDRIVFTANRFISNGRVPDITHIVYVDPLKYSELPDRQQMVAVGRAVSRLNQLLPKRQFILMGPGRWGSRGDIKLGVNVTYSDINNAAVLVEIARQRGNYVPDLSFGTHFFQDLVESRIRYLPLYPDDDNVIFNEKFLLKSRNLLTEVIPEFAELQDTIRVIDVPSVTDDKILQVLLNADLEKAMGVISTRRSGGELGYLPEKTHEMTPENFWRWRLSMAEAIASQLNPDRFGVKGFYVFGSTKNTTAGPGSDIDLLIHFSGTPQQRENLCSWLDAWSLCLAEINYQRTGYRTDRLLDVHLVTDEDIKNRTSYAVKIGAPTDPARELPMGRAAKQGRSCSPD